MKRCLTAVLGFVILTGCASDLYYFPSNQLFVRPESLNLKYESIEFLSEDDVKLTGWYLPNTVNPEKPKYTLIFFHGNAQNMTMHYLSLVWMLEQGVDLFVFDYRGYGASDGRASQGGTVRDGRSALRWMQKRREQRGISVPNIVLGQSIGSAVAARSVGELLAAHEKIDVQLLVLDSTFDSYQNIGFRVLKRAKVGVISFLSPLAYLIVTDKWAPYSYYKYLKGIPKLVIHGVEDKTVPFDLGESAFRQMPEPKEFWKIPNGAHTDVFANHGNAYRAKFLEVLSSLFKTHQ